MNGILFSWEPAIRYSWRPLFFADRYYKCVSWRGVRYCLTTYSRMQALEKEEKQA